MAMSGRPCFGIHALAMAANLQPDHARSKRLQQHLGIGRIIAEIRHNERIVVVAPIDRRQRARPRTTEQVLRQFFGLANPEQPSAIWRVAADDSGRAISTASDIMGYD